MKIIKRNGAEETFRIEKIIVAITKANNAAEDAERLTPLQIDRIAQAVAIRCEEMNRSLSVEEIQDLVEDQIMAHGAFEVAKRYITYRYTRTLVRQSNTTDDQHPVSLIECNNEEVKQENANKNPTINVDAARLYGGRGLQGHHAAAFCCREDIVEAHEEGIIHFHDADYYRPAYAQLRSGESRGHAAERHGHLRHAHRKAPLASPRPAISPRRSSRRWPPTSMAASPSL